jgi:serine phosphatase RsbU (regulator of sigma subunit)
VRTALGATSPHVFGLVLRQTMRPVVVGAVIGIAAAGALSRVLSSILFGVSPADPVGLGGAALLVSGVALGAGVTAARPAIRTAVRSPMAAIWERPASVWLDVKQTVGRAVRDLSGGTRPSPASLTLVSEFTDLVQRATSFPEAMQVALATLRDRVRSQSILMFEGASGVGYRAGHHTIPADGLLVRRLQRFPHALPLTPGDLHVWRRWANEHRPEHLAEIETIERTGARIAVPLRTRDDLVAILFLGPPEAREEFTATDREVLSGAADVFALLIENARLNARALEQEKLRRDLALAAEVQRRLLPPHAPHREGVSFAAYTVPARAVGGDYYDFLDLGHEQFGIAVADIAGKGIAAALLMSALQAWVRVIATDGALSPSTIAARMNRLLHRSTATSRYATFFYAQLDLRHRRIRYVNAGHHPPCLVRSTGAGGGIIELSAGGTVLGLFPDASYEEGEIELCPGDRLVAFTDGVTEARGAAGEEFGEARLKAFLLAAGDASAEAITSALADRLRVWTTGNAPEDDVTFVVAAIAPSGVRVPVTAASDPEPDRATPPGGVRTRSPRDRCRPSPPRAAAPS